MAIINPKIKGDIAHQNITGEVIAVNLRDGSYYSLQGVGAEIWMLIEEEISGVQIIEWLEARYPTAQKQNIEESVKALFSHLLSENLIEELADSGNKTFEKPTPADHEFIPPLVEVFTDMKDLLLLDPIHEVREDANH